MKILVIDNHSKHKDELIKLLGQNSIVETQEQLSDSDAELYDLIVLSGGSNTPSVLYNPEAYIKEIAVIQNSKVPVLGICLGSEIIVKTFGGTLKDLGSVHRGDINLILDDASLKEALEKSVVNVYEAHEVGIQKMPKDFLIYAHSEHGPEIIKHKSKSIIGVQFHPEVEPNEKLVKWLLENQK